MPDDPLHDDATTAFLFQCGKSDLFAVSRDRTGANIPRVECPDGWLLRTAFKLGIHEPVPVAIEPEPILRGVAGLFVVARPSSVVSRGGWVAIALRSVRFQRLERHEGETASRHIRVCCRADGCSPVKLRRSGRQSLRCAGSSRRRHDGDRNLGRLSHPARSQRATPRRWRSLYLAYLRGSRAPHA